MRASSSLSELRRIQSANCTAITGRLLTSLGDPIECEVVASHRSEGSKMARLFASVNFVGRRQRKPHAIRLLTGLQPRPGYFSAQFNDRDQTA